MSVLLVAAAWASLSAVPIVPAVTISLEWACAAPSQMVVIPNGASVLDVPIRCGSSSGKIVVELTCSERCSGRIVDNGTAVAILEGPGAVAIFTAREPVRMEVRPEPRHPAWLDKLKLLVMQEKVVRVDDTALLHLPLRVAITTGDWTRIFDPIALGEKLPVRPGGRVGVQVDRVDTVHVRVRFFAEGTGPATFDETVALGKVVRAPCSVAGAACTGDIVALVSEQRTLMR